ncbi:MAG: lysine--tRNA ligase [Deltaproteobacteria bacterium]|nr:lysine--tRNA ligase [Deltaproteobacteria bacterium]
MSQPTQPSPPTDPSDLSKEEEIFQVRLQKAEELKKRGINPYGNGYNPKNTCGQINAAHANDDAAALEQKALSYDIAGRVMAYKTFGKLVFLKLRDRSGELQAMLRKNVVGDEGWDVLTKFTDIGDVVAVSGKCIRTKTGELSIDSEKFTFLTKSLRPLPEKWHGLSDIETRHRQRYVDLISSYPQVRDIFRVRTQVVRGIQKFLDARDFIEVETPILHKPEEAGGAAAKPFATHHNALSLDLKLRIATELHLKRLVVGGMDRVYEIGRIFRNEGIDRKHNPEFTSVEFYCAYATYEDLISLTEEMIVSLADEILKKRELTFQGQTISLERPFPRVSMVQSVAAELKEQGHLDVGDFAKMNAEHATTLRALATYCQMSGSEKAMAVARAWSADAKGHGAIEVPKAGGKEVDSVGEAIAVLFEHLVEPKLPKDKPAFVTDFPFEVSPLARRRDAEPRLTDRFELFMAGMEVANAFSELNDPLDQRQRFEKQVERQKKGDQEAMPYDHDYVRALEFGMPPTAGEGIGIDRLVMLFTDQPNIREVILFPLLKPLT